MTRETLIADLNKAAAEVADLRSTDTVDADALSVAVVKLEAIKAELSAFDVKAPAIVADTTTATADTFGSRAAAAITADAQPGQARVSIGSAWNDTTVAFPQNGGYVAASETPVRFIDTLGTAPATGDAVAFVRESGFENAAAARLAGDPTAESNITLEKVTVPTANVAHKFNIAEENLADAPVLGARIDHYGVSGLRAAINSQALNTSDTTNGVKSVRAAATTFEVSDIVDGILAAKTNLVEAGFNPTHVCVTPAIGMQIAGLKTPSGTYLNGGPFAAGSNTVWGLTLVVDSALAACDALVYDNSAAILYVREDAAVATDRNIDTGIVTVRVQTRAQIAIEKPEAFYGIVLATA